MFTGLVEKLGTVRHLQPLPAGTGTRLEIAEETIAPDLAIGDSVAVNGACLTVVDIRPRSFFFEIGPETFAKTHLNALVSLRGRLSATGEPGEMRYTVTDDVHVRPDSPTRANVALPLRLNRPGSTEVSEAKTIDISTNGLLIECDLDVNPGELLECSLALPNRPGDSLVIGQVVNVAAGGFAVTFTKGSTPVDTRFALFELVTAQRRAEWRRAAAAGGSAREL